MRYISSLVFFILLPLTSCSTEYFDHIQREHAPVMIDSHSTQTLTGKLSLLPDKKVLESLIDDIDTAKKRIWIETYTWTEKGTLAAIERAKKRGVDVQVILEGSVYRTPWINNDTIKKLKSSDIPFNYANNRKYTFSHMKLWMIDDSWCISTGNWSYTSFTSNREFIFCSEDKNIQRSLEEIFRSDFSHARPYFSGGLDSRIGLSPYNSRSWIRENIQNAKKKIIIYNQTITDPELLKTLSKKAKSGVKIEVCQAYKEEDFISGAYNLGKDIISNTSKKPYLHAKVFLIDESRVILGSTNMTQNAIDNNRDILIDLGANQEIYKSIFLAYEKDCLGK